MVVFMTEDYILVTCVTLGSAYQLVTIARKVGQARGKFKVIPPETSGDPEFNRTFRAQQNCLEFYPIFLITLWIASVFFHQLPASILGLYYMYGRYEYVDGYVKSEERRLPGFFKCVRAMKYLLYIGAAGLGNAVLVNYIGLDIPGLLWSIVRMVF